MVQWTFNPFTGKLDATLTTDEASDLYVNETGDTMTGDLTMDDSTANSPEIKLTSTSGTSTLVQAAGNFTLTNSQGSISLIPNNSAERLIFSAATNQFNIATVPGGGANLKITADGGAISFDNENITTTGTIAGVNVTSGENPGHTHTGASLSSIDISDDTNLVGGTNITLDGDTLNVDDAFIINSGADEFGGTLTPDTDNSYDIGSSTVGLKRVFFSESTGSAGAINTNFRGLSIPGTVSTGKGDIYIGGDNVYTGYYSQRVVALGSTASTMSGDYTNLLQGGNDYLGVAINYDQTNPSGFEIFKRVNQSVAGTREFDICGDSDYKILTMTEDGSDATFFRVQTERAGSGRGSPDDGWQNVTFGRSDDNANDITVRVEGYLSLRDSDTDPDDPPNGHCTIWQSDGTGSGDDGDLMVKITDSGGTTKTVTIIDYSAA